MLLLGSFAKHRKRSALTLTDRRKAWQVIGADRHHIAFLSLVTPDLHRTHARLITGHTAQLENRAAIRIVDQFRQGVGQTAGTHIMNGNNRIALAVRPAAIDDFLTTALDLRVVALHRGKIQCLRTLPGCHRRRSTTTQPNQQGRTTEHNNFCTRRNTMLLHMLTADIADTAGDHDRLVIAAHFITIDTRRLNFQGAEVTVQIGAAKFVIERGAAERAFNHDIQRRGNAVRFAITGFPWLLKTGNIQIGHGETGQTCLGFGASACRSLVANFATGTGGRARMRCNRSGMVMGFHLHQDMHRLIDKAVLTRLRIGKETLGLRAFNHRGIILVGRQHPSRADLEGIADHAEQTDVLLLAINYPVGIKNLVAAVLRIGLSKHHQLSICRVTLQTLELFHQIINFIFRQRQTQLTVGLLKRHTTTTQHVNTTERLRLVLGKQCLCLLKLRQHGLGHAVVDRSTKSTALLVRGIGGKPGTKLDATLDPIYPIQTSVMTDVCCL